MSDVLLSTGDLLTVLDGTATPSNIHDWIERGVIVPAAGGCGQGDHRRFGLMQCVGIAVAVAAYRSQRGCVLKYLGAIVEAFQGQSEEWLRQRISKGQTAFVTLHQGKPILQTPMAYPQPDVCEAYAKVKSAAQRRADSEK